jgi:hypothetical protein
MAILINTTGQQQVTILDADADMACVSMRSVPMPQFYLRNDSDRLMVDFRLNNTFDHGGVKVDTFVYLPQGPDYHLILIGRGLVTDESWVINKYSGGNLTLRVMDLDQYYRDLYNSSSNGMYDE